MSIGASDARILYICASLGGGCSGPMAESFLQPHRDLSRQRAEPVEVHMFHQRGAERNNATGLFKNGPRIIISDLRRRCCEIIVLHHHDFLPQKRGRDRRGWNALGFERQRASSIHSSFVTPSSTSGQPGHLFLPSFMNLFFYFPSYSSILSAS